jgi:hypothetical protein
VLPFLLARYGGASVPASRLVPSVPFLNNHPAIISSGRAELPLCPNLKKRRELASSNDLITYSLIFSSKNYSILNLEAFVRDYFAKPSAIAMALRIAMDLLIVS